MLLRHQRRIGRSAHTTPALAAAALALLGLACGADSGAAADGENAAPGAAGAPSPGYPPATSRLTLRLDEERQKLCHATLVDPGWALTAAHCFAGIDPDARGALNEFQRSLSASDVVFYPGAMRSGATSLDAVMASSDFVAAHDLALVPVSPPIATIEPVSRWLPVEGCTLPSPLDVPGRFGQIGPAQTAQTAEATLLDLVPAAALLGPDQPGSLWSARGPSVRPGDSGSGFISRWEDLLAMASECEPSAGGVDDEVLMGVIQDANPEQATLPFGLIPLHLVEHARWIATVVALPPPSASPERPRLDL